LISREADHLASVNPWPMAERRQALHFPFPYGIVVNSQFHTAQPVRRSFLSAACRPRIDLAFVDARSFRHRRQGHARQSFFHSPDLIVLHRIYCIAPYVNYPIQSKHFILIVSREDWFRLLGSAAPHPVADKLISLFLRQPDLASASESRAAKLRTRIYGNFISATESWC